MIVITNRRAKCPVCDGRGRTASSDVCAACNGAGTIAQAGHASEPTS